MKDKIREIASKFDIWGDFLWAETYGSGHINDTYLGVFNQAGYPVRYIFQRVNTNIFKQPEQLMDNIARVLTHCKKKLAGRPDASRRSLTIVNAFDGKPYYIDPNGRFWRCYLFIDRAKTYDILETTEHAYQAAKAFGGFQQLLADLPGERLYETIPNFHNTPSRVADFDAALAADSHNRAAQAKPEIEFVQKTRQIAPVLLDLLAKGEFPERITHNDTKLNNVMLDVETGEGICVIDLDTIMPGISLYDFGDLVRTSVSPAAEDECDLSKVQARMEMFEALAKGFLEGSGGCFTKKEVEMMPFSGMLITFEIGVRFITDFLNGDQYFKIHRENHNLDRCRTQFTLVERLREKEDYMNKLIKGLQK